MDDRVYWCAFGILIIFLIFVAINVIPRVNEYNAICSRNCELRNMSIWRVGEDSCLCIDNSSGRVVNVWDIRNGD